MIRRSFVFWVALPLLSAGALLAAQWLLPSDLREFLYSEQGLIEVGTAVLFALAGTVAFALFFKSRSTVSSIYRVLIFAFAVNAWLVALEEVSYGQQFVRWQTPQWFAQNNSKHEVNLHNLLDNKPSRRLRNAADVAYPICCIALPVVFLIDPRASKPGRWTYYLVPRSELTTVVLIAQAATLIDQLAVHMIGTSCIVRAGEVKELYWGLATLCYTAIIWPRWLASRASSSIVSIPFPTRQLPAAKAA